MKHHKFGTSSLKNLEGVHPDLFLVITKALELSEVDFSVVEGVRTIERQRELMAEGKSQTLDSCHIPPAAKRAAGMNVDDYDPAEGKYGNAVDLYPWVKGATSHDEADYKKIARAMFQASQILGVVVEWGGLWESFVDMPHWQRVAS